MSRANARFLGYGGERGIAVTMVSEVVGRRASEQTLGLITLKTKDPQLSTVGVSLSPFISLTLQLLNLACSRAMEKSRAKGSRYVGMGGGPVTLEGERKV